MVYPASFKFAANLLNSISWSKLAANLKAGYESY